MKYEGYFLINNPDVVNIILVEGRTLCQIKTSWGKTMFVDIEQYEEYKNLNSSGGTRSY